MPPISTRDGLPLHRHHWPCEGARGHVLVVHGLGEHGGRYAALAQDLVAAGHAVSAYDHRGHGRSGGARGVIARADSLCDDLALVIDTLQAEGHPPTVLLGHSMGGLLAARFVAETLVARPAGWKRELPRLVLSSPALDAGLKGAQRALLALMGTLLPSVAVGNGLQPEWISRDPAVVQAYRADPLVHDRITARLARFLIEGAAAVRAAALGWRLQTLLLWGGGDRIVSPEGARAFAAASPASVVTAHEYPGLYHEILNEVERGAVHARLEGWLACI